MIKNIRCIYRYSWHSLHRIYKQEWRQNKHNRILLISIISFIVLGWSGNCLADVTFEVGEAKGSFYVDAQTYTMFHGTKDDPDGDDEDEFDIGMWSTSNVGIVLEKGDYKAYAEFGFGWPDDLDVYTRLLYGTWNSDTGTLTVGRAYTPYLWGTHEFSDDYNGFSGHGSLFDFRQTLIKFALKNGFYITVIETSAYGVTSAADAEIDSDIPKLAIGYDHWGQQFSYGVGAAYQTYKESSELSSFDESINAGFVYFHGTVNLTEKFSLSFNTHYGQNLSQFGVHKTDHQSADFIDGKLEDTTAYGGFIESAYTLNDTAKIYAGIGYTIGENDKWSNQDDKLGLFANCYIKLGEYLTLVPEISYTDNLQDKFGEDQADQYWIGLTWQVRI